MFVIGSLSKSASDLIDSYISTSSSPSPSPSALYATSPSSPASSSSYSSKSSPSSSTAVPASSSHPPEYYIPPFRHHIRRRVAGYFGLQLMKHCQPFSDEYEQCQRAYRDEQGGALYALQCKREFYLKSTCFRKLWDSIEERAICRTPYAAFVDGTYRVIDLDRSSSPQAEQTYKRLEQAAWGLDFCLEYVYKRLKDPHTRTPLAVNTDIDFIVPLSDQLKKGHGH